jgi:hypothetical protein
MHELYHSKMITITAMKKNYFFSVYSCTNESFLWLTYSSPAIQYL